MNEKLKFLYDCFNYFNKCSVSPSGDVLEIECFYHKFTVESREDSLWLIHEGEGKVCKETGEVFDAIFAIAVPKR